MAPNRCAIYTRKSNDDGLEQDFNSLDAQREACTSFITSQRHEGWETLPDVYEDGGFSGGHINRPGIQRLLEDCKAGKVDTIVVYKIDRLTRSLADFAKMVEMFDVHKVSFVSVTQQFNTTTSMGRLTLNVLLSFAQFEREVTGERIRDKIAASKAKGMWMGGKAPLGYDKDGRSLMINPAEAELVQLIFTHYLACASVQQVRDMLESRGQRSKQGYHFNIAQLIYILSNPIYLGQIRHKDKIHPGLHTAILSESVWKKVQTMRQEARKEFRHRSRAKEGSLLCGILFDAEGNPMSPSHSNKKGKRYRYYLSQAYIQGRTTRDDTITKIPAPELETIITNAIGGLLGDDERLTALSPSLTPLQRHRAAEVAIKWKDMSQPQQQRQLRSLISQVTLYARHLTCNIRLNVLEGLLGGQAETENAAPFTISIRLKQIQGGATYILSKDALSPREPNPTLVKAIAKAYRWNHLLITGQVGSMEEIAQHEKIQANYVRKLISLAWFSPAIIGSILEGNQPEDLSLSKLHKIKSAIWVRQDEDLKRSVL